MRPWLAAVFALHLFLSAGAWAFGPSHGGEALEAAHAQSLVIEAAAAAAQPATDEGLSADHWPEHGLADAQADLPECLDVPIATSAPGEHLRTPSPPAAQDLTPPVLDGLQRPPRGLPALA
ncbi:MAG: hypothetical protein KIT86_05280 [Hydrogenophaga sp.]|uniref:hypothetical protein n=1 Tax=Hydrogenophaga sp. TaxID=1904254 RepID=UPI002633FC83|nr:hypothetical protein [Hydrogenophaga sp.]MCW5669051.1 hypothetical protein [Hydrogenophaga sp.]